MENGGLTIVWQFTVKAGKEEDFDRIYGPNGNWAVLFRKAAGYSGTELHRSREIPARYLVIDRWESPEAFKRFKEQFKEEYRTLDLRYEELTEKEEHIGNFTPVIGHNSKPVSS